MFGLIPTTTFQNARRVRIWTLGLMAGGMALAAAAAQWWPEAQTPLAVLLIATVGIQHGALDHILHAHMHGDPEGPLRQSFVLPYVAAIGVCWLAFEWAPAVMLGVFLCASAYHFGMSHLRIDAMRNQQKINSTFGVALGIAVLAPLVTRPDALLILEDYGWDLSPSFADRFLPLQLASASAVILAAALHATWRNGLLACTGIALAWCVDDLLLAFALYFVLGHSREAFFEEFKERQSLSPVFSKLYLRSLPLSLVFAAMAGAVLWTVGQGLLNERAALSFLLAGTLPHIAVLEGWVTARLR